MKDAIKGLRFRPLWEKISILLLALLWAAFTPIAAEAAEGRRLFLSAVSTQSDLIVLVSDEDGRTVTGERFELILSSPDMGEVSYFTTDTGRCYIVELSPGEYTLSMADKDGYTTAESISVQVRSEADFQAIPDISRLLEIVDAGELDGEIKDNSPEALEQAIAQVLSGGPGWRRENGKIYYIDDRGNYAVGLKKIDGKLHYFNERGEKASSLGVDVSCFNGIVNYPTVKAQGIDFVIARIGGRGWESGLMYTDSMALDHIRGAKAAGLKVGVYFYSTAVNAAEAIQEASLVIARLAGLSLDLPVYIDMEYSGSFPTGRADTLSPAQRIEIINAFGRTLENCGYMTGIYSSESLLRTSLDHNYLSRYCVWMANYTENNALPSYPYDYHIWQFTDRGVVEGMGGNVDLNVIF